MPCTSPGCNVSDLNDLRLLLFRIKNAHGRIVRVTNTRGIIVSTLQATCRFVYTFVRLKSDKIRRRFIVSTYWWRVTATSTRSIAYICTFDFGTTSFETFILMSCDSQNENGNEIDDTSERKHFCQSTSLELGELR